MLEVEMSVGDKENYGSKAVSGISSSSARELQPFAYCSPSHERSNALHEIGGWGAQPTSHYAKPVAPGYTDEDSFPSSQLSSSSTASIPAKAKGKRVFEDDDADDESEPSNMSAPPNAFSHIMQQHPWGRSRGLRGKRRVFASRAARPMAPVPNFIPDFEEADFLRSRDDETMDTS